jgi:uncharacterized protein YneF (UPF0154 family)
MSSTSIFKIPVNEKSTIEDNRKINEQAYSALYLQMGQEMNSYIVNEL